MDIKVQNMLFGREQILSRPISPLRYLFSTRIVWKQNLQPLYGVKMPGMTSVYSSTLPRLGRLIYNRGATLNIPQFDNGTINYPDIAYFGG